MTFVEQRFLTINKPGKMDGKIDSCGIGQCKYNGIDYTCVCFEGAELHEGTGKCFNKEPGDHCQVEGRVREISIFNYVHFKMILNKICNPVRR